MKADILLSAMILIPLTILNILFLHEDSFAFYQLLFYQIDFNTFVIELNVLQYLNKTKYYEADFFLFNIFCSS